MTGVEHYFAKFQAVTLMNMKKTAIFWHEDIPEGEGSVFLRNIDEFLSDYSATSSILLFASIILMGGLGPHFVYPLPY